MQTKSGMTFDALLDVTVSTNGLMKLTLQLSETVLGYESGKITDVVKHIETRIATGRKPCATYSKVMEQIEAERLYLAELYSKLFETYQRAVDTVPKVRMSPKDKAMVDMLSQMPDKMLRDFTAIQLGDTAGEFILPDEREQLIDAYISNGKAA